MMRRFDVTVVTCSNVVTGLVPRMGVAVWASQRDGLASHGRGAPGSFPLVYVFCFRNQLIMGLHHIPGGRNKLFTCARKLFLCNVYTIMIENVTASPLRRLRWVISWPQVNPRHHDEKLRYAIFR